VNSLMRIWEDVERLISFLSSFDGCFGHFALDLSNDRLGAKGAPKCDCLYSICWPFIRYHAFVFDFMFHEYVGSAFCCAQIQWIIGLIVPFTRGYDLS